MHTKHTHTHTHTHTQHSSRLIVSVTLLERISTDPPDVIPTLNTTLSTLEQLVNTQQLTVSVNTQPAHMYYNETSLHVVMFEKYADMVLYGI